MVQAKPQPGMLTALMTAPEAASYLYFQSSLLLVDVGGTSCRPQSLTSHYPAGDTVELLGPSFGLAQPQLLHTFGK